MPSAMNVAGIAHDFDTDTVCPVYFNTPDWDAILEWLRFHNVDPCIIPAGTTITRSGSGRCIRYEAIAKNEDADGDGIYETYDAIEQGEAPPLPFPSGIAARLR